MKLTCPECGLPLHGDSLTGWCANGHGYKYVPADYPCDVDDDEDEEETDETETSARH